MARKQVRVLAAGTFDFLHPGHLAFLQAARRLGSHLAVVVAHDSNARRLKGARPIFTQAERARLVGSLKPVDRAVKGRRSGDVLAIVRKLKPDVIALGPDQWPREDWLARELAKSGLEPRIVRLDDFEKQKYSSGRIATRILKRHLTRRQQKQPGVRR